MFGLDSADEAINRAKNFIGEIRALRITPLIENIELFISKNKLIIWSADAFLNKKVPLETAYCYEVFSENALIDARKLADELSAVGFHFIQCRTISYRQIFAVTMDGYDYIKFYQLAKYKNATTDELMNPVNREFTVVDAPKPMRVVCAMPLLLEHLYHGLYTGEDNLNTINEVWKVVDKSANVSGTSETPKEMIAADDSGILIGSYAAAFYLDESFSRSLQYDKMQIISDDAEKTAQGLVALLQRKGQNASMKSQSIHLPRDPRLFKFTIICNEKQICDVFNSAEYELIPFKKFDKVRVAAPEVIIRFLLIEYFTINLVAKFTNMEESILKSRLSHIVNLINKLRNITTEVEYFGKYSDYFIDVKIKAISDAKEHEIRNYQPIFKN